MNSAIIVSQVAVRCEINQASGLSTSTAIQAKSRTAAIARQRHAA